MNIYEIKKAYRERKYKDCLRYISDNNPKLLADTILIQARLSGLTQKTRLGIVSLSDAHLEKNQIERAIEALIKSIDPGYSPLKYNLKRMVGALELGMVRTAFEANDITFDWDGVNNYLNAINKAAKEEREISADEYKLLFDELEPHLQKMLEVIDKL